jgi:hypothetical protein
MLMDRDENKVTSFKPTKYDFVAAYLDTQYCCFYCRGCTPKYYVIAVGENANTLRVAWKPTVHVVNEREYDFDAYEWPWMKHGFPGTYHYVVCVHIRNKMRVSVCMVDIFDTFEQGGHEDMLREQNLTRQLSY